MEDGGISPHLEMHHSGCFGGTEKYLIIIEIVVMQIFYLIYDTDGLVGISNLGPILGWHFVGTGSRVDTLQIAILG